MAGQNRFRGLLVAAALVLVTPVVPASASGMSLNAVILWDLNAQTAIWDVAAQQPQNISGRSFAMVSAAVYDAVNAIAGTPYQPYLVAPRASGRESTDAAVATAATRVLADLFPEQADRLRTRYETYLAEIPDGHAKRGGVRVGDQTAAAMVAARENDGSFGDRLWPVGDAPGQWRPTPPGFGNAGAWFGHMTPFAIPDASMFPTPGPPALTSRTYARDLNEIKRLGSVSSTARTADQTESATWWHDRRSVAWEIKRNLATTRRLNVLQTARLFAMSDISQVDATLACAYEKERWRFWRPVTAVRLADTDGNPRTTGDPDWTPLLTTPAQPDYPSGNTCDTSARMAAYTFFFGRDDVAFSAYSVDTGTRRHFSAFSQALAEVTEARILGGVHFRTADVDGGKLGRAVAGYITAHHFRPLG